MSPAFRPVFVGLALTALATSACVDVGAVDGMRYVDHQEKRFTVQGRPELRVSTFDGPIEVRQWDQPEVLVVIERRAATREAAERIDMKIEQDGDRITVAVRYPDHTFDWVRGGRSARLIVSAPAKSDLNARSGDGAVDVEGLTGRIEVQTGDGSIRGNRLTGDLKFGTGDGSIRVSEASGLLTAQTGDGSVNVEGALSGVTIRTGDGTVTLVASPGSAASDDWTISTGDGSVMLDLPDAFSADLDAHTGDGRIAVENLTVSDVSGKMARNRLRGQIGTGGRLLRVRTGDGSITLRKTRGLTAEAPDSRF
jgi:DUF4097 and DUF4098 domain-containing protein YvlB